MLVLFSAFIASILLLHTTPHVNILGKTVCNAYLVRIVEEQADLR